MTAPSRKRESRTDHHQVHKMEILGTMAGGLAHDFNNVLAGIGTAVQSLMPALEGNKELLGELEAIHQETRRASEMIQHLLRFTRATPERTRHIPLEDSIRQMLPMLRWALPGGIKAKPLLAASALAVRIHRTEIEQILLNLVINARDAMPRGGCIEIQTSRLHLANTTNPFQDILPSGLYASLTVSDNGTGIAPEILPRVFDPFFTTKRSGKGSGLGLSVVQSIIRKRRGHIYIENRASGGTRVVVLLPAKATASSPAASKPRQRPVPRGQETILIADDNMTFVKAFSHLLQSAGFRVIAMTDGQEAIARYTSDQDTIDAVMLDTEMPLVNGPDCLAEILKLNPNVKVIMMSGNDEKEVVTQCTKAGAKAFLAKPFDASAAIHLLRKVLDKA